MKNPPMTRINVTALREQLPACLARVTRGERIAITSRGRVIAELSPPRPVGEAAAAARKLLPGSVVSFERPLEPTVAAEEWDANQ
jgi:antitoxin (DNA-binding transcriptional repressor) of toxin-antitoxin stability system